MTPTAAGFATALIQQPDIEIARHAIEAFAQRFRHRHTVRAPLQQLGVALFAREPDALDARQPLRVADIADEVVDRALELGRRNESVDRYGRDRLSGIGRLAGFLDEIDHVATHRGAIERAGQDADDEAQTVALIFADRQQIAFIGFLRIGQRLAVAVDHPADWHLLAPLRLEPYFAEGGHRRRHIKDDRRLVARRHRDRHRTGAEEIL